MRGARKWSDEPAERPSIRPRRRCISDAEAFEIRRRLILQKHDEGLSVGALAVIFGLSVRTIQNDISAARSS